MKNKYDVVIVGAGITALTTALHLVRGGLKVALVEKTDRVGGQIRSYSNEDFVYESGPNTGVLNCEEIIELFKLVEGEATLERARKESKKRLVLYKGEFRELPSSLIGGVTTPLFSFKDKLRVLGEPFRGRGKDENESVGEFAARRLGKSIVDYAVDPFVSGIYAGDPYKLVTKYALPKLYNLEREHGSFIRGTIKRMPIAKEQLSKGITKEIFSAKSGLGELTKGIAKLLEGRASIYLEAKECRVTKLESGEFRTTFVKEKVEHSVNDGKQSVAKGSGQHASNNGVEQTSAKSIEQHSSNNDVEQIFTKSIEECELLSNCVVTTCGAYELDNMLPQIDKALLNSVTSLYYAPIIEVAVGYKEFINPPASFGGLIPSKEGRDVLGILFPSACFSGRAPEGGALLSIFIGGVKSTNKMDLTDEQIKEMALKEVRATLGEEREPDLIEVFKHSKAIPQYYASSKERFAAVEQIESKFKGLIIGGNLKDGIGLADRVRQGRRIAEEIVEAIAAK